MIESLYKTSQNMTVKMRKLNVISNNLANISTVGYKKDRHFANLVEGVVDEKEAQIIGVSVPRARYEEQVITDFEQGDLVRTGNVLDLAIKGDGFFVLQKENGEEVYTRDGHFALDNEGYLVDMDGNRVMGAGGEIYIDNPEFEVNLEGEILVNGDVVDQVRVVDFQDRSVLMKEAGNQWKIQPGSNAVPEEAQKYEVFQGFLERSNVNPIEEMVTMIALNRGFESSYKVVRQYDSTLGKAANEIGKMP